MKLRTAEFRKLEIPLKGEYKISDSGSSTLTSALVILETADGRQGIGTADVSGNHPIPQTPNEIQSSLTNKLLPELIDSPPENPNKLYKLLKSFTGDQNAKCAIETAYFDLFCRNRGQSIADFLGGQLYTTESLNAWVGIDTPVGMAEEATKWYQQGFESLKMKIKGDYDEDLARIRAVWNAVGEDMQIRIDANEGYSDVSKAIDLAKEIEEYEISHFEQPISRENLEDLKHINKSTSLTIMADEPVLTPTNAYHILNREIADRLKFKILKQGGINPVARMLDFAEAADINCVVGHGFCTLPAASAELQLTSTRDSVFRPVETVGTLKVANQPFRPELSTEDGVIEVPNGPGLGVEVESADKLSDYTCKKVIIDT